MKKIKSILLSLIAVFTLTACPSDPEPDPVEMKYLEVYPSSINFTNQDDYDFVEVYSNVDWTASSSERWCEVWCSSMIRIDVTENTSAESREATITVSGGGITKYIYVSQQGATSQPQANGIADMHDTQSDQPAYSRGQE